MQRCPSVMMSIHKRIMEEEQSMQRPVWEKDQSSEEKEKKNNPHKPE